MIIKLLQNTCRVDLEEGEKLTLKNESAFWYWLKGELNKMSHLDHGPCNLIKKLMDRDGHLMGGPGVYYLRDKAWRYCIYDGDYAVRDIIKHLKRMRGINLRIEHFKE